MLYAGTPDGVYRIDGVREPGDTTAERVLDADHIYRVRQFHGIDGLFAAGESGLYYSPDGTEWTAIAVPEPLVYAVTAGPSGDRLYAGTRPARVFTAAWDGDVPTAEDAWEELEGFRELRHRTDWGIPRHDGLAQVRSLQTHPDTPGRIVVGVEVGGVHVSDDHGATWTSRPIDGYEAPHTDDIHHLLLATSETVVASTGTGAYRSADAGRTWHRLDVGHPQRYFREAFIHDGSVYAGGSPGLGYASWDADTDHGLFESHDGRRFERVASPTPDEVAIGWCAIDHDVIAATHRGTLLRRRADGWTVAGSIPTPASGHVRYLPLSWDER